MNINTKVRILLSGVLAIIAVALISSFLSTNKNDVTIIVAGQFIKMGVIVEENMLLEKKIPKEVRDEFFPESITKKEDVVGLVSKRSIKREELIYIGTEYFANGDELKYAINKNGIINDAFFIPDNCRLISIEVDNSGSINYTVKEGDYVDVIFSSVDESTGGLYTSMLLQHIKVYDVEKIVTDDGGVIAKKQNITLVGTSEECLKLVAGNRNGILDLALNPFQSNKKNLPTISILSYSESIPSSREQILNGLKYYITNLDLRESVKLDMIEKLESEQSIEALEEYIKSIKIEEEMRNELLNIISWER